MSFSIRFNCRYGKLEHYAYVIDVVLGAVRPHCVQDRLEALPSGSQMRVRDDDHVDAREDRLRVSTQQGVPGESRSCRKLLQAALC
jgi:hypothetical protein